MGRPKKATDGGEGEQDTVDEEGAAVGVERGLRIVKFALLAAAYVVVSVAWFYVWFAIVGEWLPGMTFIIAPFTLVLFPFLFAHLSGSGKRLRGRLLWLAIGLVVFAPNFPSAYYASMGERTLDEVEMGRTDLAKVEVAAELYERSWRWMPFNVASALDAAGLYAECGEREKAAAMYDRVLSINAWSLRAKYGKLNMGMSR